MAMLLSLSGLTLRLSVPRHGSAGLRGSLDNEVGSLNGKDRQRSAVARFSLVAT